MRRVRDLTSAQWTFAQQHDASPSMHAITSPRMVFMYREKPHRTSRWLVDEDGRAVDLAVFDRHALVTRRDALAGSARRN